MSVTWRSGDMPPAVAVSAGGWARAVMRGAVLSTVISGGLVLLLLVRLFERPLCAPRRPLTPWITQFVCRSAFVILGIGYRTRGHLMRRSGAVVANHSSWLDIFALNARKRIYFVSKSEVAGWPGIGWLATATGTVFISRDARAAKAQKQVFETRLKAGHKLLFFPEGTSSDGLRVLSFKSTLFAAFFTEDMHEAEWIQPVTVAYAAPPGRDARFYGWWGDMEMGPHLLQVLAARRQGSVTLIYHPPIRVADHPDRKSLAQACEAAVRGGLAKALPAEAGPV